MAHDARQQKKLAKLKAKRMDKRKSIARSTSNDPTIRLAGAAAWPVADAMIAEGISGMGLGVALLSRRMPNGAFAVASFVVDIFCLGVKDCFWKVVPPSEYPSLLAKYQKGGPFERVAAVDVVKLVNEAIAYARSIGFPPHEDHRHARMLFTGIDPALSTRTFVFGKDGKPFYIQGPHDTAPKIQSILRRIKTLGGNFTISMADAAFMAEAEELATQPMPRSIGQAE